MVKQFFIIVILLLTSTLFSSDYEIKAGNDIFGMNLYDPIDDARTFGLANTSLIKGNLWLNLDYNILTDRAMETRIDEATLTFSYPMEFNNLTIDPYIGVTFIGDIKGGNIQNDFHKLINVYQVNAEYDDTGIAIAPLLSSDFTYNIPLFNFKDNILKNYTTLSGYYSYNINAFAGIATGLAYSGNNFNYSLDYGYSFKSNISSFNTLSYVNGVEDHGVLTLESETGMLKYRLHLYPNGNYATGVYSVTIGGIPKKAEMSSIDSKQSVGLESVLDDIVPTNSHTLSFLPLKGNLSRFEIYLSTTYGWMNPNYSNPTQLEAPYYNGTHFNRFSAGTRVNLLKSDNMFFIRPYIGAGLGNEGYHYFKEYNSETQTYDDIINVPVFELEGGATILFPQLLYKENVRYGVNLSYKYRDALNENRFNLKSIVNISFVTLVDI